MAPTSAYMVQTDYDEPISRTYQYRKVMKPMLERKRRARINRCLDELKELMVTALQSEGENVSKLEKADILELTVRHLHQLKRQHQLISTPEQSYADRFRAGFTHCAAEVSHFLSTVSAKDVNNSGSTIIDPASSAKLLQHLSTCIRRLEATNNNSATMMPQQTQSHQQYYQQSQQQLATPVMLNQLPQSQPQPQPQQSPHQQQQQQYTPPTSPAAMMMQHYQHQQQQFAIEKSKFLQQSQQKITTIQNHNTNNSNSTLKTSMWRPW